MQACGSQPAFCRQKIALYAPTSRDLYYVPKLRALRCPAPRGRGMTFVHVYEYAIDKFTTNRKPKAVNCVLSAPFQVLAVVKAYLFGRRPFVILM